MEAGIHSLSGSAPGNFSRRGPPPPASSRMQYRRRPVSVSVDPVSLVISECIAITSAMQKHARSGHSSVSAILGGSPNVVQLGSPVAPRGRKSSGSNSASDAVAGELGPANRWGLRGKKGKSMQDNPLISGFARLRHELTGVKGSLDSPERWGGGIEVADGYADIAKFDSLILLFPFLQIIQAKGTAAPITVLALRAVRKFLSYGFIAPESPRFALAMQSLSTAITHCQFDIIDPPQEEVVLLMILHLMEDMLSGPGGDILSDDSICDLMGRGLTICSRKRFSEVLRQTAEASMVRMCQIIFEDLKHLEDEAGEESDALDKKTDKNMDSVKMDPATNGTDLPELAVPMEGRPDAGASGPRPSSSSEKASSNGEPAAANGGTRNSTSSTSESSESVDLRPYSLPSIRELFRALVNFLDPHDKVHPDHMRVMALRIINVALEVAGPSMARHPALAIIAEDRLCCYLFQLVRSDNMAVLQEALVVTSTLLSTCRGILKLQQELYLSYLVACLHPSVEIPREPGIDPSLYVGIPQAPKLVKPPPSQTSSGRSTPVPVKDRQKLGMEGGARKPDARQAMIENIGVLARMPTFMVELFVNYDCDENRADLCEDMIGLLSRNALPDSVTWSTTSVPPLCLDALLRFIQFIAERLPNAPVTEAFPDPGQLRERRRRKKLIIKGTSKFNESPKGGLAYLQEKGIISDASDPSAVARFLRQTSRVNKKMLGEFIAKKGNEPILDAFIEDFRFSGKRIDEALRALLESFRLPGESPLIERIVKAFTERYCDVVKPESVANPDAAFVLTYAIIMLNVDQHSPKVKQARMEPKDFARNLRGVNDGKDFDPDFLQEIFDAIRSNEIILPDEHDNKHAFDYAWKELLLKTESTSPLVMCDTNIYDADMFAATWNPIVSCLSFVFMSATDDTVFGRVITGFDECARIAAKYGNAEALDEIIYRLSYMSTLATDALSNTALNTEVQVNEKESGVMVSELAVKFGSNFRAQLATLVLFRVITRSEHVIQDGWQYVRVGEKDEAPPNRLPWLTAIDHPHMAQPVCQLVDTTILLGRPQPVITRGYSFAASVSCHRSECEAKRRRILLCVHVIHHKLRCRRPARAIRGRARKHTLHGGLHQPVQHGRPVCQHCVSRGPGVLWARGRFLTAIRNLPSNKLKPLVEALLDELPEDASSSVVITVKAENAPQSPSAGQGNWPNKAVYDPATVYILEFCTTLALRDEETISAIGKPVVEAVQGPLRDVSRYHPVLIARATYYLFKLLQASYVRTTDSRLRGARHANGA